MDYVTRTSEDWLQTTLYTRVLLNVTKRMKSTYFVVLHQYYFKAIPLQPDSFQKYSVIFFHMFIISWLTRTAVLSVVYWSGSNPGCYLSLCGYLIFSFILLYTQVRRVRKYYIIIYTPKKHHFTWTSVFNCLIELFSFLEFNYKIT